MRTTKFDILFSGIMLVSTPCYSSWTKQTVDSSNSQLGWDASIGVDSNNIPHIAYGDTANGLQKYAKWTGTAWSVETVDSASLAGSHTSIRVTSSGYPYFSYYNGSLRFAKKIGSTWTRETVTTGYNYHTSIALDSNSWPAITYYDGSTKYLKYVKRGSSAWGAPETVDTGDSGYYSSLEFDSSNYPAIAYYDSINYDLKYAKWNGSSWVKQTVDSTGDVGEYVSLALDSSNNPHISYLDRTNYNLKYAKWNGSSWVKQTVDPAGDVGGNTSIALDAAGNPHITYYDFTNIAVKYAKWNGSSWQIETVDSPGGSFASIAIDNNGNPHIAYASSGVQKYATITAGDSWDPIDDTAINGTPITPTTASQSHGPHIISGSDLADWFRIYMSAGNSYHFDTIGGSGDDYGELYSNSAGTTLVASNDDGGGNGQFTFDYVAPNTQNYYLKVRAYTAGDIWSGSLNYYYTAGGGGICLRRLSAHLDLGLCQKARARQRILVVLQCC